ncbi:MAG: hypothetical protein AAGI01_01955 [Myxococcota bacterium]
MKKTLMMSLLAATSLASIPTDAGAQDEPPAPIFAPGARAAGMGEAYNALSAGTSGVFHNPSGIARAVMFGVEGSFNYARSGNTLSAAVIDSKTNPSVAAGFGVNYFFTAGEGLGTTALDLRLPIAVPVVPQRISFGVAVRYLAVSQENADEEPIERLRGLTFDAGALFRVVEELHLGITARNLIDQCDNNDCAGFAPTTVGGGLAYVAKPLAVAVDVEADLNSTSDVTLNIDVGAEFIIQQIVPVQVGFRRIGPTEQNWITAGVGFRAATAGVDLSYQHNLSAQQVGLITLGVSAFF